MNYEYPDRIDEFLKECIHALENENRYVRYQLHKQDLDKNRNIEHASLETSDSKYWFYRMSIEDPLKGAVPAGLPCTVNVRNNVYHGAVEETNDERTLTIALREDLGDEFSRGTLDFDFTELNQMLISYFEDFLESSPPGERQRLHAFLNGNSESVTDPDTVSGIPDDLNHQQEHAIQAANSRTYQMVWGPPGTGKTRTLSDTALTLHRNLETEKQILIASHTNVAVDNAIHKIFERVQTSRFSFSVQDLSMIRYGQVNDQFFSRGISLDHHFNRTAQKNARFVNCLEEVEQLLENSNIDGFEQQKNDSFRARVSNVEKAVQFSDFDGNDSDLQKKYDSLLNLEKQIEKECIKTARIVGTTITQLFLNPLLRDYTFDIGLIDEISMMGLALSAVAGSKAKRVVCFGDEKQLPPVVQSNDLKAQKYLGKNLFQYQQPHDHEQEQVIMLQKQYRMPESVCNLIDKLFYDDRLVTEKEEGPSREPVVECPLFWLDTSEQSPQTERPGGSSLKNAKHAQLSASIARQIQDHRSCDIGIVTPYRAQVQEIRRVWRGARNHDGNERAGQSSIEVNTVHSFQGREKDVIIFDTVLSPPETSYFLDDRSHQEVQNIVNVAASRASESLILVANVQSIQQQLSSENVLSKFVDVLQTYTKLGSGTGYEAEKDENVEHVARTCFNFLRGES